jgi:hypothetical protein
MGSAQNCISVFMKNRKMLEDLEERDDREDKVLASLRIRR